MAYNATVCKVMIASPGDVEDERDIAREVIWNWNYLHSERTGIILMPVGWDTHSAPAMGDRAQTIINKQVLEGCDLLIGIFWTRLGTPTGQAVSGTVEEINEHRRSGKPAMLYFSQAPVHPKSVEPQQYERLQVFKERCEAEGLIASYNDLREFKDILTRHLIKTVDDDEYFKKFCDGSAESAILEAPPDTVPGQKLSSEARELLLEAVNDPNGSVLSVMTMGGLTVQTNNRNMVSASMDERCQAMWRGAVDELVENDLIADVSDEGEVFRGTRRGYELADLLKSVE